MLSTKRFIWRIMRIALISVLLGFASLGFSQTKENNLKELYSIAIKNHINALKDIRSKDIIIHEIQSFNFIADEVPTRYLPKYIDSYKIKYVDLYDKRYKRSLRTGKRVISIQPITLSDDIITINLIDFWVRYKSKNYDFANRGSSVSSFKYSPKDKSWHHLKTTYSGL
ncbi:hypothetical protein SAMN05192540_1566 [Maribacter dokdonensis]|uniref:Uncharacterized protein n=2 Tax=Maribacter dokdonensis TaxID=320912 RepID=A0A1H4M975_9FLAO|nr:hypothetical protein SAMN05192540_1566 [Maribacter dokdonensis]